MKPWGKSLLMEVGVEAAQVAEWDGSGRALLVAACEEIVRRVGMEAHGDPRVEWFGSGDAEGWTAVQLLTTSHLVIHTSTTAGEEGRGVLFVDLFSCRDFAGWMVLSAMREVYGVVYPGRHLEVERPLGVVSEFG